MGYAELDRIIAIIVVIIANLSDDDIITLFHFELMYGIIIELGGGTMAGICTLAPDINSCPHYDREEGICGDGPEMCGFFVKDNKKVPTEQEYIRQPRWYEEFMK